MRTVRPPFPWRYTVLVSGETDPSHPIPGGSVPGATRRVRVLDAPVTALGALREAVLLSGGAGLIGPSRPAAEGPGKIADGLFVGAGNVLRTSLECMLRANRDLAAAVLHSLDSFGERPACWNLPLGTVALSSRPLVMGILNVTPDSFSDGGRYVTTGSGVNVQRAVEAGLQMVDEGADLLDVGGESTRPGAESLSEEMELQRVRPVLEKLCGLVKVPISIDTSRASVAAVALDCGASIVNDVRALAADTAMLPLAAARGAGVVLMHMQGEPPTMQSNPHYDDLVRDIFLFLARRVRACLEAGIPANRIAIDPGIGFGKTLEHNLSLLRRLREFTSLGLPVMVGPSRKGFLGKILDLPVTDRLEGTVAAAVAAVLNGVSIVRVHDVRAVVRGVKVAAEIAKAHSP